MNRRSVLMLLAVLMSSPASADCLQWTYDANGNRACVKDDLVNRSPFIYSVPPAAVIGNSGTTNYSTPTPDCKPDEEAVMRSNYHWACAKNVRER
jgi:hypothetical protein